MEIAEYVGSSQVMKSFKWKALTCRYLNTVETNEEQRPRPSQIVLEKPSHNNVEDIFESIKIGGRQAFIIVVQVLDDENLDSTNSLEKIFTLSHLMHVISDDVFITTLLHYCFFLFIFSWVL